VRGLWKVPDLWTRKRPRAHKVLGRRQTDAGAHTSHRPRRRYITATATTNGLAPSPRVGDTHTAPHPGWPVFKCSRLAGFQRSVTVYLTLEDRELPEREPYSIVVRGIISVEDAADPAKRELAQQCVDGLAALLNACAGIQVLDSALVREDEFTLHDLARAKYWDWDWLSADDA
jgi:hypothetical protein